MGWLLFAIVLAIPATVPATAFRWLSIEYALGIIWAGFFLCVAWGLLTMWQPRHRDATAVSASPSSV
jgi:tryptophan-rich sensory protein